MSISFADGFRKRQLLSDLAASMDFVGPGAIARLCLTEGSRASVSRIVAGVRRFTFPADTGCYSDVLLAAAMPDDDFPAFVLATCLLLSDRLAGGDGKDDLFWNWDAFNEHYCLADAPVRAAILGAFRAADDTGLVRLETRPADDHCFTRTQASVLAALDATGLHDMAAAIRSGVSAGEAGRLWAAVDRVSIPKPLMDAFRYLFERPQGLRPPDDACPDLIPWG